MRHLVRYGIITAWIVAGVLLVAGCGGDKGTGSSSLTTQDQFDELTTYINLDPDSTGEYFDVADLMLSQTMTEFWDGIDESDFDDLGGFLSSGLAASASADADTFLSISYDPAGGWWYVDFLLTQTVTVTPPYGFYSSIAIKDSIRYETSDGTPQMIPDESTTHRVLQNASMVIGIDVGSSGNSLQFDVESGSNLDATGLNTSVVNITGDGSYTLGIAAVGDEGSVDMTIGMESSWDDVVINDPTSANPCPTAGGISGNFTLDMDVQDNTGHYQANGTWDIGVDFTGDGNTTVSVQSGDFQKSYTGNICAK